MHSKSILEPLHVKLERGTKYCHICEKAFSQYDALKSHIMSIHLEVVYSCPLCANTYKDIRNFRNRHFLTSHPESNLLSEPAHCLLYQNVAHRVDLIE